MGTIHTLKFFLHIHQETSFGYQPFLCNYVVAFYFVVEVIVNKSTRWFCYGNVSVINNSHHIWHTTLSFEIHHHRLHFFINKPHYKYLTPH